jgi:cyclophilin family peptidyl-prolyl cis-trans isomerase
MKVIACLVTLGAAVNAFIAPSSTISYCSTRSKTTDYLQATAPRNGHDDFVSILKETREYATRAVASALVAGALWAAPAATTHVVWPIHHSWFATTSIASAKEMASASGSRVNKDAESLLRYGLPINNKEIRQLQSTVYDVKIDIGSKRKSAALDGVKKARTMVKTKANGKMIPSCRDADACAELLAKISAELDPLERALRDSVESFTGSEQERAALDRAYESQEMIAKLIGLVEENMVPAGYKATVPSQYSDLPQLEGRATVEMVFKKPDNAPFNVNGQNFPKAKLTMVIDGYTAPITGGNFVDLVQKGFYNNMKISRSDGFVVQTGNPEGEADGYVGTPSKSVGAGPHGERLIPNEIFLKGDKAPLYETTVEDEGRGGEATVLPFSSYGAMGWAREEYDVNSGSSQFFWLLFDSDLTPAGKNVLDGRYPCFGYVVDGSDFLTDIKEGDIIVSAKVTDGLDKLKQPSS